MKCCDLISKNEGFLKKCVIIMNELYFNKYCYNKATNMYSKNSQKREIISSNDYTWKEVFFVTIMFCVLTMLVIG